MELRNKIEPFPSKRNVFPYLPKESQRVPPRPGLLFPQKRRPSGRSPGSGSPEYARIPGPPARTNSASGRPAPCCGPPGSSGRSPGFFCGLPGVPLTPSRQLPGNFPETSRHPSPFLPPPDSLLCGCPRLPVRPRNARHATTPSPALPPGSFPAFPRRPPARHRPLVRLFPESSAPVPPHFPAPALPPARRSPHRLLPPGPTFHLTSGREQRTQ